MKAPIIIVGGGIAGLTTKIALDQLGIESLVLESAPDFKPVGAGLSLGANAIKAFRYLGLEEEVVACGKELHRLHIKDQKGQILMETDANALKTRYGISNFAIHRHALHELLLKKINPKHVLSNHRVQDIDFTSNGVKFTTTQGHQFSSEYLIAADGIHSPFRKKMFPNTSLRFAGYTCWRAVVTLDKQVYDGLTSSETWGKNGRFGIVQLPHNQVYWFATHPIAKPQAGASLRKQDVYNLFQNYHAPIPELIAQTPEQAILWNDIFDFKPLKSFTNGQVLCIGDAAHATTPNLGQGACMAIEDAAILQKCLRTHATIPEAFQAFEIQRIKRTTAIVNTSWRLGKVAEWQHPIAARIRNTLVKWTPKQANEKQLAFLFDIEF